MCRRHAGLFQTCFLAAGVEIVGPRYRYVMGLMAPNFWTLGAAAATGVAYFVRERIALQLLLTAPLLFFVLYIWCVVTTV